MFPCLFLVPTLELCCVDTFLWYGETNGFVCPETEVEHDEHLYIDCVPGTLAQKVNEVYTETHTETTITKKMLVI